MGAFPWFSKERLCEKHSPWAQSDTEGEAGEWLSAAMPEPYWKRHHLPRITLQGRAGQGRTQAMRPAGLCAESCLPSAAFVILGKGLHCP